MRLAHTLPRKVLYLLARRRPSKSAKRRPNAPRPVLFKQADAAKPISNRKIAKALGVGEMTVRRDIAPNVAPAKKTAEKTKASQNPRLRQMSHRRRTRPARRPGLVTNCSAERQQKVAAE